MAEDREILKEIWSGQIPVHFQLASIEVVTMQQPEAYYAMVPRVSYFPIVIEKAVKYFSRFIAENKHNCQDLWLEFEGQPLKWHYPIGLIYDLLCKHIKLPWTITIHFEEFPEDEIFRLNSRQLMEAYFMSTIKEADFLKHRSLVVNGMQKREHNQLWNGLLTEKFESFWQINRKLMESTGTEGFRLIPIRCYRTEAVGFLQKLVKPANEQGEAITLEKVAQLFFDQLVQEGQLLPNSSLNQQRIIIHGIEPSLDTPIQWLSEHFSYPDNFLHICLTS